MHWVVESTSVLSEVDWQLAETSTRLPSKPKRDLIAYDGQKLTPGDTTITMYLTPGHTLGTISTIVPVRDGGRMHLAAEWGGTGFNFEHSRARFETYAASAQRLGTIVAQAGADVHIANTPTRTTPPPKWPRSKSERLRTRTHTWSAPTRSGATCRSPSNAPASAPCGRNRPSAGARGAFTDWHRPGDPAGIAATQPVLRCVRRPFTHTGSFASRRTYTRIFRSTPMTGSDLGISVAIASL